VIKNDYLKLKKNNQTAVNCFSQEWEITNQLNGITKQKKLDNKP